MESSRPTPLRLRPCEHADGPLAPVMARIRLHAAILRQVRESLPAHLAAHCRDCVVSGGQRLIVYTDGPAWTFQLRFHAPMLPDAISRPPGTGFTAVEFRSLPAAAAPRRRDTGPRVSMATAKLVTDSVRGNEPTELTAALDRLGRTLEVEARAGKSRDAG